MNCGRHGFWPAMRASADPSGGSTQCLARSGQPGTVESTKASRLKSNRQVDARCPRSGTPRRTECEPKIGGQVLVPLVEARSGRSQRRRPRRSLATASEPNDERFPITRHRHYVAPGRAAQCQAAMRASLTGLMSTKDRRRRLRNALPAWWEPVPDRSNRHAASASFVARSSATCRPGHDLHHPQSPEAFHPRKPPEAATVAIKCLAAMPIWTELQRTACRSRPRAWPHGGYRELIIIKRREERGSDTSWARAPSSARGLTNDQ